MTKTAVVVVSGAAGAIGGAAVRAFRTAGHPVVALDVAPVDHADDGVVPVQVDLTDARAVAAAVDSVTGTGPLGHVVGVAGGALPDEPPTQDTPTELPVETFRASVDVNLVSQYTLVHACLPWLRSSGPDDRSVILTSSWNALTGQGMPAYSSAKAGLIGMMRALVHPLGLDGIRVNVVAPGTIRTPRTERIWGGVPGHFEALTATTVLGRLGEPADVAAAFRALALDLRYCTGQVLVVDGGQTLRRR